MNNNDWLFLKVLAEERNVTKAAKRLFISQPAMTDKIKKLEKELNIPLVVRKPRGIEFTPEGSIVVQYATKALHDYEDMKAKLVNTSKDGIRGTLKIAVSNVFAKYRLPQLITEFRKLYPLVDISFKTGISQVVYQEFLCGDAQLAVARGTRIWGQIKHLIWREPICLFSPEPLDLTKLDNIPFIKYKTDPSMQAIIDDWWFCHFHKKPNIIAEVDAMDTGLKMVEQGVGCAVFSESCAAESEKLYSYPLTLTNGQVVYRDTWLYYRNDYAENLALKALIEYLLTKYPALEDAKHKYVP